MVAPGSSPDGAWDALRWPCQRAARRQPPSAPGTHLHVALTAGASDWGGGALHTQLGQKPHGLEQEQTRFHLRQNATPVPVMARAFSGFSQTSSCLSNCMSGEALGLQDPTNPS